MSTLNIGVVIVPPSLHWLGYPHRPDMIRLNELAIRDDSDHFSHVEPWCHWRDILENLGAASIGYKFLTNVADPGTGYTSELVFYHSKAMVGFSQSALELMAMWMHDFWALGLKRPVQIAFHTQAYRDAAEEKATDLFRFLSFHAPMIDKIKEYRRCWHHRAAGGVSLYSNDRPDKPGANLGYAVPIDPRIDEIRKRDVANYVNAVEQCRKENGGEWLYTLPQFSNLIFRGAETICAAGLELAFWKNDKHNNAGGS